MRKLFLLFFLVISLATNAQESQTPPPLCPQPINLTVTNVSMTGATFAWTETDTATAWEVAILPAGVPAPTQEGIGILVSENTFTEVTLPCGTAFDFYVRSICSQGWTSLWVATIPFSTLPCFEGGGYAQDLLTCPENGQRCYDLHQNDVNVLGTLDPELYSVTYYANPEDGNAQNNPLSSPICLTGSTDYLVARLENNASGEYGISPFFLGTNDDCAGLRFHAFIDSNHNGVLDPAEDTASSYQALMQLGHFSYEINNDGITNIATAYHGIHTVYDANTANNYDVDFVINPEYGAYYNGYSHNGLHTNASGVDTYYFPITAGTPYSDMSVSITPNGAPRPGFEYTQYIGYRNRGNQATNTGTLTYVKDPALTFVSVSGDVNYTADGFTFDFANMQPFESRFLTVVLQVPTIPTVALDQPIHTTVSVASENDAVADNNVRELTQNIIGSYDPNDKMEAHGREIVFADFDADDYLYYTIRFENTGTASAYSIKLTDVLDAQFDETTVRPLEASLDYRFEQSGSNLTWLLDGIDLPPTVTNPILSHGYVTFKVKLKPGFAVGSVIENSASIYFDFNPAIVTEPFVTEFVEVLGVKNFDKQAFTIYPNPTGGKLTVTSNQSAIKSIAVFDVTGKQVQSGHFDKLKSVDLDVSDLQPGLYFVKVTTEAGATSIQKLIKK